MIIDEAFVFEANKPSALKQSKVLASNKYARAGYNSVYSRFRDFFNISQESLNRKYDQKSVGYINNKNGESFDVTVKEGRVDEIYKSNPNDTDLYSCTVIIYDVLEDKDAIFKTVRKFYSYTSDIPKMSEDLKNGIYLEDFFAKYADYLQDSSDFESIINTGDALADSFYAKARAREQKTRKNFWDSKVKIRTNFGWEVTNDNVLIHLESLEKNNDNTYKKMAESIIQNYMEKYLTTMFNKTINELNGLFGSASIVPNPKNYQASLYLETKNKSLIYVDQNKNTLIHSTPTIDIGKSLAANPTKSSEYINLLFDYASKSFLKGFKKGNYIENHYLKYISGWYGTSATTARQMAADEYEQEKRNLTWDGKKAIRLDTDAIIPIISDVDQLYNKIKKQTQIQPRSLTQTQSVTSSPKPTPQIKAGSKAEQEAIDKMTAWHNGTRGFNAKSAGDAKLIMNYKICKKLGFDNEADYIKQEADRRNLTLESRITLSMMMEAMSEKD